MNRKYKLMKAGLNVVIFLFFTSYSQGCKKLVEVESPNTSLDPINVYATDATAASVLTGIYSKLSASNRSISDLPSLFLYAGLSSDELELYNLSNNDYLFFYRNSLNSAQTNANFWNWTYPIIYFANSAVEGLNSSGSLTPEVKSQLIGESKFVRAFCYFYLTNLYGDVCLATSTDWQKNALLARESKDAAWQQIIDDLLDAKERLSSRYLESDAMTSKLSTAKVRPTKWAAAALLSRAYLYKGEWSKAEEQASLIIDNPLFALDSLNGVFKANSKEAIWQLQPTGTGTNSNTGEGRMFVLPSGGPNISTNPVYLSSNIVNSFEFGDQRKNKWVSSITPTQSGPTYHYAYKYKIGAVNTSAQEYIMMLRLGELYLIRSEARLQQNNFDGAKSDLNEIRFRAGLQPIALSDRNLLLDAIMRERKSELFTEWGHRWLDIKRTGAVDSIMTRVCVQKGGVWNSNSQLYPLSTTEMLANPNLVQNKGY